MTMKGIVLAGGTGSRLFPLTYATSKQLLPVYDKPLIYYSLSVLMLAQIRQICIIVSPEHLILFKKLLGNGEQYGIDLTYEVQERPEGIAQAFILAEDFISNDCVALVLGDNIFYGLDLTRKLVSKSETIQRNHGACIFGFPVKDPERFGVAEFDADGKISSIEEKPISSKSNMAITGLYFYDNTVVQKARKLKKSNRGEYEISDVNKLYLKEGSLNLEKLGRGYTWFDTGTVDSLLDASNYVAVMERQHGYKIACLEEIALRNGWITQETVLEQSKRTGKNEYAQYLRSL